MKRKIVYLALFLSIYIYGWSQTVMANIKQNDSNTQLHLMKPEYKTPYGIPKVGDVKSVTDRILLYLENVTPAKVIDSTNQTEITDFSKINKNARLNPGVFRLTSYEWGVTYAGMLHVAEITNDKRYTDYISKRFDFLSEIEPYFAKLQKEGVIDPQMRQVIKPEALDDAGAICSAMIKAEIAGISLKDRPLIDNYIHFIMEKDYRLPDGLFARNRPQHNSVWLDDMYMSIPAIVNMGRLTGDTKYFDEAVKQVILFKQRMWIPEKKLFRHGWIEAMKDHPSFYWARANGWAIMTLTEVLDALPENYQGRNQILELLQNHIRGIVALQSGEGFWHQLLDRNDSYLETSATAIFTYCIAHAINKGWIDGLAYGPVAMLGWNAVSTKINETGEVEGTCVGTGMGFDPAFYYYRPVSKFAAHGYGPVLLAGAEIIKLVENKYPKVNDSAVHFYRFQQKTNQPIFGTTK